MKAKETTDWQTKEWMHDSFVHTIRELQGNDLISQSLIEFNKLLHSNWVGLLELVNQPIISKQHVQLTTQIILAKIILEEILGDISIRILETKYVINLGQLLRIVPNIKRYI
jgi:hypothetical protein